MLQDKSMIDLAKEAKENGIYIKAYMYHDLIIGRPDACRQAITVLWMYTLNALLPLKLPRHVTFTRLIKINS